MGDLVGQAGGRKGVTSVALTVPNVLSVAGSPITGSGTLAVTLATQTANLIFAGPTSGGAAAPTFRSLVVGDIPVLDDARLANAAILLPTASSRNVIQPSGAAVIPLIVKGFASQTANLQEWQNSAGTALAYIDSNGTIRAGADIALTNPSPRIFNASSGTLRIVGNTSGAGDITLNETGSGKVGVGEATPTAKLHVSMNTAGAVTQLMISGNNGIGDGGASLTLADNNSGKWTIFTRNQAPVYALHIATGLSGTLANAKVTILATGEVGIGQTSINFKLDVNGDIGAAITDTATSTVVNSVAVRHLTSGIPAAAFGVGVLFQGHASTSNIRNMGRIRTEWTTATDASRASKMVLSVYSVATEIDTLSILSNGILIPNAASYKGLDTGGAARDLLTIDAGNNYIVRNSHTSGSAYYGTTGTGAAYIHTNNVERIRIDNAGLVSIGNITPTSKLDVNGDIETLDTGAYYLGDPTTDGSWRIVRSGSDLLMQRRIATVWTTKSTITG